MTNPNRIFAPHRSGGPPSPIRGGPIRALIIEDDEDFAALLVHQLRDHARLEVTVVGSLLEGYAHIGRNGVDVVLLDLGLPDADGLDGLSELRGLYPDLAIVVLTGHRDQETCVQALEREAQDYLVKGEVKGEGIVRSMLLAIARRARTRVTEEEREALEEVAYADPLTGLLNRRGFQAELQERGVSDGTAILIDFDDFKDINSEYGHAGGDRALAVVAKRVLGVCGKSSLVARIGGDEFLVVLPNRTIQDATDLAARIRDAVRVAPVAFADDEISVTVSLGIAWIDGELEDIEEILERTRQPLALSKGGGKNGFAVEGDLQPGLPQVVDVEFQPVVNLWSNEVTGYEAFVRAKGKIRSPQVLFAQARLSGQELELDLVCMRSACEQAIQQGLEGVLFLNVLPATLIQRPEQVLDVLSRLPRSTPVCLEIRYTSEGVSPAELAEALLPIRRAGVSIGFDDIGSNQRPLEHLFALRPDVVKVPLNEASRKEGYGVDSIILQSLADLGQAMGFEIIGKRVETREDVDLALSLGIQRVQGKWMEDAEDPFAVPAIDGGGLGEHKETPVTSTQLPVVAMPAPGPASSSRSLPRSDAAPFARKTVWG